MSYHPTKAQLSNQQVAELANETLSDKLWSAYSKYVLEWCEPIEDSHQRLWKLDPMAQELLDQAVAWDTHRTF